MKKTVLFTTLFYIFTIAILCAQDKHKKEDIKAIKAMCGCFEVKFNFAETFSPDTAYDFHDNYLAKGLEWVTLVYDSENKLVLQHLLIVNDSMIIKHWRQDWLYENTDFYTFDQAKTWHFSKWNKNKVKGQWTQKVYQVDDSPRYEGTASWIHKDGRHYWENQTYAPLPRREFSKRNDYNIMRRLNHHEITSWGWVHEQDNHKIIRTKETDSVLAEEKGWNTYRRIDTSKCQKAEEWWSNNSKFWADVRNIWDEIFATHETIQLHKKVDEKLLHSSLFQLNEELIKSENYSSVEAKKKIRTIITSFLK